ncbi:MAG: hypothetical protein OIF34_13165 [Porticoccaceae bacterium]|nr:hypothetical protein [Porticoccaceae bacterium]
MANINQFQRDDLISIEIYDETTNTTYLAEAEKLNAKNTEACWRVRRVKTTAISEGKSQIVQCWAGGSNAFVHKADNLPGLTYVDPTA